ncbi:stationary-phase survival acid phosphatase [Chlamydia felis Fe/C-56]|uniref:5'-nucleotidase SurE n=1 Tax=Chlamydia felis (strain Fe/C-56) TaxID=264202 RepID=SURE_CHLFF|nr:5'/3'-nucleotidase SurE [Chlamydia felis]Q254M8.1 RecName: Full=5'-nucleotidase SurE; AltName: Full=Nucleoside 5'-monophosphate phosphohydrolase [Chlamydia felis Fe/C-56]BAE81260.1 stationary-phase survival acid phosphatase [Chlamydia felis Fe/C-56]
MNKKLKVLLTNDDGIFAKGISLLVSNLLKADFADLYIVAPNTEQSGKSMSFSYTEPVSIERVDYHQPVAGAWAVSGSPVDCIKLALGDLFLDSLPDIVLSGINNGSNAGRNIFYSGTAGAAMEAVISGIPAIAFSQEEHISCFQEKKSCELIKMLVLYALSRPFPLLTGFNVNFPACENNEEWQGMKLVATGKEFAYGVPRLLCDDGKRKFYSLNDCQRLMDEDLSEECHSLLTKKITVAPLLVRNSPLGLMSEEEFQQLQQEFEDFIHSEIRS